MRAQVRREMCRMCSNGAFLFHLTTGVDGVFFHQRNDHVMLPHTQRVPGEASGRHSFCHAERSEASRV
jgi:hypothetical protein